MKRDTYAYMRKRIQNLRMTPKLLLAILLMMVLPKTFADSVILRDSVQVSGAEIALKDLAHLEGNEARKLADIIVYEWKPGETHTTLTMHAIRAEMKKRPVNWALLLVKGSNKIRVIREDVPRVSTDKQLSPQSVIASNQSYSVSLNPAMIAPITVKKSSDHPLDSEMIRKDDIRADELLEEESPSVTPTPRAADRRQVRHVVIDWLRRSLNAEYRDLQVEFRERDEAYLDQLAVGYQYEITTSSTELLGRRTYTVMRYRNRIFVDSRRMIITVKQRVKGYVAVRNVHRNGLIHQQDVALKSLWVSKMEDTRTITQLEEMLGLVATTQLNTGEVITTDKLQKPLLVKRGQTIRVKVVRGNISVEVHARAKESGARGDLITVQHPRTKKEFVVKVIGSHLAVSEDPGA